MGVKYYIVQPDALYHHGTEGMKWYHRNGPPYPLQGFQRAVGSAVAKGRVAFDKAVGSAARGLKSASDYAGTKIREKHEAKVAKRKEEQEDIQKRKTAAASNARLIKMAKKHPEWLTDAELDALNNTKRKQNEFEKNYVKKKESEASKQIKDAVVKDFVTPYAVALGKAAVMSAISGGDFQKIASVQINKAEQRSKSGNNNKNESGNNNKNESGNKMKPKKPFTKGIVQIVSRKK